MPSRIQQKPTAAPAARTPTAESAKSGPARTLSAAENLFTGTTANLAEKLSPRGTQVQRSASPEALWEGLSQSIGQNIAQELAALPDVKREARISSVKAELSTLDDKIGDRLNGLEKKWKRVGADKKERALRRHVERNAVPSRDRAEITKLVNESSGIGAKIDALAAELKRTYPPTTRVEVSERRELKEQLVALRVEQRALVNEAKAIVDASGQSAALMVAGEGELDPNAPPQESLGSMVVRWLHLSSVLNFFVDLVQGGNARAAEARKEAEIIDSHIKSLESEGFSKSDLKMISFGFKSVGASAGGRRAV